MQFFSACRSGPMAVRKPAVSLADSSELRVIFSILYTIVETIRTKSDDDTEEFEEQRKAFKVELGTYYTNSMINQNEASFWLVEIKSLCLS